jgi:farnesyl diphosphate synthase
MDESESRRGQPCWYRVDNIGLAAFNDALLLESAVYFLLHKHFSHLSCYNKLVDAIHDVTHKTIYGQSLDTRTAMNKDLST